MAIDNSPYAAQDLGASLALDPNTWDLGSQSSTAAKGQGAPIVASPVAYTPSVIYPVQNSNGGALMVGADAQQVTDDNGLFYLPRLAYKNLIQIGGRLYHLVVPGAQADQNTGGTGQSSADATGTSPDTSTITAVGQAANWIPALLVGAFVVWFVTRHHRGR